MTTAECISDVLSSLDDAFIVDQDDVIKTVLRAKKVVFLDTCFITKSFNIQAEKLFIAFEKLAGGKDKGKIVFVITELILYELKDSETNVLQERNKDFLQKMSEYGFCLLVMKEETVCNNISLFMDYSNKKWNEVFSRLIHDNVANLSFSKIVKTDKRMPYFGFHELNYRTPADSNFINDIIVYLKNAKKSGDSMAEELICTSLFFIFELTSGSMRSEYIFCTHDLSAIARMNKAIQTSYPNMQKQLKTINILGIVQYMVKEGIITSREDVLDALKKIMENNTKIIILENSPFTSIEKIVTIEEIVEMIFDGKIIELTGIWTKSV